MEKTMIQGLISSLYLRNQIVGADKDKLVAYYSDKDVFLGFIDILGVTLETDCVFLLLNDEMIDKIYSIIQANRYKYTEPNILEAINWNIRVLNHLSKINPEQKETCIRKYLKENSKIRGLKITSTDIMLKLIMNDAIIYDALLKGTTSSIDDFKALFSSIMFLISYIPYILLNATIRKNIFEVIDYYESKNDLDKECKKYLKDFKRKVCSVKVTVIKEEE